MYPFFSKKAFKNFILPVSKFVILIFISEIHNKSIDSSFILGKT